MRYASLALLVFASLASFAADDPRKVVIGTWRGTSTCTGVRPSCKNEVNVYHIAAGEKPNVVMVAGNKVVDGKELEMGTMDFTVDFENRRMVNEFDNGRVHVRITLHWTAHELTGQVVDLPGGEVVRNISLKR